MRRASIARRPPRCGRGARSTGPPMRGPNDAPRSAISPEGPGSLGPLVPHIAGGPAEACARRRIAGGPAEACAARRRIARAPAEARRRIARSSSPRGPGPPAIRRGRALPPDRVARTRSGGCPFVTNPRNARLSLRRSRERARSAPYNTRSPTRVVCKGFGPPRRLKSLSRRLDPGGALFGAREFHSKRINPAALGRPRGQIGRASCRERV